MEINSQKIRALMESRGWDKIKLSLVSGLSVTTIEAILRKKTTKLKTINRLGLLLDVDPKDLLT